MLNRNFLAIHIFSRRNLNLLKFSKTMCVPRKLLQKLSMLTLETKSSPFDSPDNLRNQVNSKKRRAS